ncbi:MAG: hypothetical protein ACFCD0_16430 [Gemmataceae bacterium]
MPLTQTQLDDLRQAAGTLVIIGKFGGNEGIHEFEGGSLHEQAFFDRVKPSIGRRYEGVFIGRHGRKTIKLVPPLQAEPGSLQKILPDSPLLKGEAANREKAGRDQFERLLQLIHTCTIFQHPAFSKDLLDSATTFVGYESSATDTHALDDFLAHPSLRAEVQHFLLCPADEQHVSKAKLDTIFRDAGDKLGKTIAKQAIESLEKFKEVLSNKADLSKSFDAITGPGASCSELADDKQYHRIPDLASHATQAAANFRSAYRFFKTASDETHARCRSPELWSYLFWWLGCFAGALPEEGFVTGKTEGIRNLYELCIAQQADRIPAVGERLKQLRDAELNKALGEFGTTLREQIRDLHRMQAQCVLEEMRKIFDPNRPTQREDIEQMTASLYKGMAFLVDEEFRDLQFKFQEYFGSYVRVSRKILNQRESQEKQQFRELLEKHAREVEQEATDSKAAKQTVETIRTFLASESFQALQDAEDLREQCDVAFYGHAGRRTLEEFEKWAKENEAKNLEKARRVEKLFRFVYLGQKGAGHTTDSGLPTTVQLDLERLEEWKQVVQEQVASKQAQQPQAVSVTLEATVGVRQALGGERQGQIHIGTTPTGDWSLNENNGLTLNLKQPMRFDQFRTAKLVDAEGKELMPSPQEAAAPAEQVPSETPTPNQSDVPVVELDLAHLDQESKGAIVDKVISREATEPFADITEDDLAYWFQMLEATHKTYLSNRSDAATKAVSRSYRAAVLGRYLLASPDTSTPFGQEDIGNVMGLLMDMFQHLGELDDQGRLKLPTGRADRDNLLRKVNLSQYYPVEHAGELSTVFNYHNNVIASLQVVNSYLKEVNAVGKLIGAASGSKLRILVVNRTLGEEITEKNGSNNVLTQHPCRVVYLTTQNHPQDLANAWANLLAGLHIGAAAKLQIPIFVVPEEMSMPQKTSESEETSEQLDTKDYPCVCLSAEDRIPGPQECNGLPEEGERLALACALTSAQLEPLRAFGLLKQEGVSDKRINDLTRAECILTEFQGGEGVISALRMGLVTLRRSTARPHRLLHPLLWSRMLTKGLMEYRNSGKLPVRLIESLGRDAAWSREIEPLFHGLDLGEQLLPKVGSQVPDGTASAIDNLQFSLNNEEGQPTIFPSPVPPYVSGAKATGIAGEPQLVQ